jgi:hypothetical protein
VLRAGRQLWDGLEKTLSRPDFYDEKSFVETVLDQEANGLLLRRKELMLLETWVLHRRLLEASFPGVVKKSTFTLEKATVPVRVLKTKNPIVLVLCSYNSVLWQVIPDKDARIDKIIVGGYHLQAVKGAPAPVTYRTYEPKPTNDYFYAYKKESESYPKMCAAVRKLTGQEVTTFEGRYSYAGGFPFMVGAAR